MREVKEIERRFLLKRIPIVKWTNIYDIAQYYIRDTETGIIKRLRASYDVLGDNARKIEYLHKINVGVGEFVEVHEDLPSSEFTNHTKKAFKWLGKRRYVYNHDGLKFEVDVIDGLTLVLMEVELEDIKQEINFPDEIKEEMLMEVTGVKSLSNFELARLIQSIHD